MIGNLDGVPVDNDNEVIIGIDLGTTYCCVYYWDNGEAHIAMNACGDRTTPSYISFHNDEINIGNLAKEQINSNPTSTIYNIKRFMGMYHDHPQTTKLRTLLPYAVVNVNGHVAVEVCFENIYYKFYPEELSAMLLYTLKVDVERIVKKSVRRAVITVPEHFNSAQRDATKLAGRLAGLHVIRLITEPTAAALVYSMTKMKSDDRENSDVHDVIVYDLGGGTFDVTLMTVGSNVLRVEKTRGNRHLGGENFVENLISYSLDELLKNETVTEMNINEFKSNRASMQQLRKDCELLKRRLTTLPSAELIVKIPTATTGRATTHSMKITRQQFNNMNHALFMETINAVRDVIHDAQMQTNDISEIVLIGGSSRIHEIKRLLNELFGKGKVTQTINQDEGVAHGACLMAANLVADKKYDITNWSVFDVAPFSLGISARSNDKDKRDKMVKYIHRNQVLPAKYTHMVRTVVDNQTIATINVYEGESKIAHENMFIQNFDINNITPMPAGQSKIEILFDLNADGILNVTAMEIMPENLSDVMCDNNADIDASTSASSSFTTPNNATTISNWKPAVGHTKISISNIGVHTENQIQRMANRLMYLMKKCSDCNISDDVE